MKWVKKNTKSRRPPDRNFSKKIVFSVPAVGLKTTWVNIYAKFRAYVYANWFFLFLQYTKIDFFFAHICLTKLWFFLFLQYTKIEVLFAHICLTKWWLFLFLQYTKIEVIFAYMFTQVVFRPTAGRENSSKFREFLMFNRKGALREGRDLPCIFSSKKLHPENNSVEHQWFKSNCQCNLLGILHTKRWQTCVIKPIFLTPASHQDDGSMHKANSLKLDIIYYIELLNIYYILDYIYIYIEREREIYTLCRIIENVYLLAPPMHELWYVFPQQK